MNETSADAPLARCMVQPKYITRWQAETPSVENVGPELTSCTKKPVPYEAGLRPGTNNDL
jgi:hypothetical protein